MVRVAVVLTFLALSSSAMALRCGTRLVDEGDTQGHVQARCGEPVDVSLRIESQTVLQNIAGALFQQTVEIVVESWTYNFGPTRFMQRLEFRDGIVSRIETLGRGYRPSRVGQRGRNIHLRESRGRVRATWGEPTEREVRTETSSVYIPGPTSAVGASRTTEVEYWTYNFGPSRFMRRVVFEDGQVVRVETLGRGY
ncbi:MAG: DUF2845 domain-containing protein [Myxococcota bacterium]